MADNSITQKSPKSADSSKTKFCNVIQRTTSETLRLGETDSSAINLTGTSVSAPAISAAGQQRKKPCSSFQITSVVVGRNNDGGDDSADDLDESHADDISDVVDNSRITDNETPSYSEDTYSKEEVFYNVTGSSLCSAPVIPTSAQYGIAIVPPPILNNATGGVTVINSFTTDATSSTMNTNYSNQNLLASNIILSNNNNNNNNHNNSSRVDVSATPKPEAIETATRDPAHNPGRNDRFKVVKIESTEPFKRGRWMCMDYLDHTMNQQFVQQQQHLQQQHQQQQLQLQQQQQVQQQQYQVLSVTDSLQNTVNIPYLHSNDSQTNVCVMGDNLMQHTQQQMQQRQQSPLVQTMQQPAANAGSQPQIQQPAYYNTAPGQQLSSNQQYLQYNNQAPLGGIHSSQVPTSMSTYAPLQQVTGSQGQQHHQMNMVLNQQSNQVPTSSPTVYNQTAQHYTPTQTTAMQYMQSGQSYTNPQMYATQQPVGGNLSTAAPVPTATPANTQQKQQQNYVAQVPQGTGQAQSYAGPTQSSANVPTQGQSYAGQTSQIMSSGQGQSYSPSQSGTSQIQSFPNPSPRNYNNSQSNIQMQPQSYIPQSQPQQQQQTQNQMFGGQQQQQQQQQQQATQPFATGAASYSTPNPASQIQQQHGYSQNIASSVSQTQNFVSMPSSPASVGQHPLYPPAPTATASQPQVYTQPAAQQQTPQTQYAPLNVTGSTGSIPYLSSGQSINFIHNPQQSYPTYSQSQTSITSQTFVPVPVNSQSSCTLVYTNLQCSGSGTSQLEPSPSETSQMIVEQSTSTSISEQPTITEEPMAVSGPEESESATGNSAVAIDNKIEQAMDLVKSHLMFAVREEVEVLKEKIAELMDRINQLETENSILKAHASLETLATLAAPSQAAAANALLNATAGAAAQMTAVTGGVFTASTASSHTNQVSPGSGPSASGGSN